MALTGVRVGPLDPDATAEFGQVSGRTSARQLVRHHLALNPPALIGALSRSRQKARSDALDIDELYSAIGDAWGSDSPGDFELVGASVRGEDDAEQVVTFTWRVPVEKGGTGRTGKGFVAYDAESLPESVAAGDEAVRIEKLKEAGLPWAPSERALAAAGITGSGVAETAPENLTSVEEVERERDEARKEAEALRAEADELRRALAEAGGEPPQREDTSEGETPPEPWDGYEGTTADDVKKALRNADDDAKVALAERVLAYEQRNGKRAGVIAAANSILDRQPASG
jgi:hypothetical protein